MSLKKEKIAVVIGALLLTGVFVMAYLGINAIAFADATTSGNENVEYQSTQEDNYIHDNSPRGDRLITETADLNNGRETGYFNVDRLMPLQDHYLTRYEAEVIVAEILYDRLGMEFDTSKFIFGLLDRYPDRGSSMWMADTRDLDAHLRVHTIAINAVTGELLAFGSSGGSVEFFNIVEHNGISFVIEDWGCPIEGSEYQQSIRPYMLSQTETALIAADLIYEEFGATMEGLRMQMPFGVNDDEGIARWNVWIMPAEHDSCGFGCYQSPDPWFYLFIDAITGEIIEIRDFRDANEFIIGTDEN